MADNLSPELLNAIRNWVPSQHPEVGYSAVPIINGVMYQPQYKDAGDGPDYSSLTGFLGYDPVNHGPGTTYNMFGADGSFTGPGVMKSGNDNSLLLAGIAAALSMGYGLPAMMGAEAAAGTAASTAAGTAAAAAPAAAGSAGAAAATTAASTAPAWLQKALGSAAGSIAGSVLGGGGSGSSGGGGAGGGSKAALNPMQLAYLLREYDRTGDQLDTAQDTAGQAAKALKDATDRTNNYTDALAAGAGTLWNRVTSRGGPPSSGGLSGTYIDAASQGPDVGMLQGWATMDRAAAQDALARATDAASRRVDFKEFSTDGVSDRADQMYSRLVGGIDRANTIASSQGFASALRGGIGNSSSAATMSENIARRFADEYSKLRETADQTALKENQSNYATYLSGQNAQVAQNMQLAQALSTLASTAANTAARSSSDYVSAGNSMADRLLRAVGDADSKWIQTQQLDTGMLSNVLTALTSLNGRSLDAAKDQNAVASDAARTAAAARGTALGKLVDSNWGIAGGEFVNNLISGASGAALDSLVKALGGGTASSDTVGLRGTKGDQEGDYDTGAVAGWWAGDGDGLRGTMGDQEGDFQTTMTMTTNPGNWEAWSKLF